MAGKIWWLIRKDVVSELRSRQIWPTMLVFGAVVVLVFALEPDLSAGQRRPVFAGMLWVAVCFAGTLALDGALSAERDDGCIEGLLGYPMSPAAVYLAKLAVNITALALLECLLVPLFVVLTGVPLLDHAGALLLVAVLGNIGISAVGTLMSAVTFGVRARGHLLALLVLPLVIPVLLAASASTRLMLQDELGSEWWKWIQLLGAFAVIFVTAGSLLFELVIEE